MATYYPSSSNQREIMPTLYVRDPRNSAYQESSLPGNMVYLDYSDNLAGHGHLQPQQNCAELLVPTAMLSQDSSTEASESTSSHQGILSNLVASRLGEHVYNVWRDGRNEMLFMQPTGALTTVQTVNGQINSTEDLVQRSVTEDPQMGIRTQLGVLHSGQNLQLQRPNVSAVQGQGLSLSLSTHIPSAIPMPSLQFQHANPSISFLGPHQSASGDDPCKDDSSRNKQSRNRDISPLSGGNRAMKGDLITDNVQCAAALKQMQANPSSYGLLALASTIPNSKYLKAAQQLLEEVVNVRKALKNESDKHQGFHMSVGLMRSKESDEGLKGPAAGLPSNPQESTTNSADRLSPVERQDLQMKLTKLLAMQDEVDRRYKQYYHQMQMVVSSFDVIAGRGAAKPYTALALQTISRHFRCLRDALSGQIRATRRSLGEQDNNSNGKSGSISRLRYVDQQLRQQRALQQLGMMQQHAWRPQRGLPENSVSILRAWLFEHFLHPYPKDSDKLMLARQTGLSRSQVSNWFINARVRLWKPMVEEMYKEELGNTEMDSNSSSDCGPKAEEEAQPSEDREEPQSSKPATERCHVSQFNDSKANPISESEIAAPPCFHNGSSAQNNIYGNLKARNQRPNTEDCSLLQDALVHPDGSGRFMLYQVPELRRFDSEPYAGKACISNGGGVSLTLGLQHCDGGLSGSGSQQNYVTVREDEMYNAGPVGTEAADYDCLNLASRRHRFRSNHLLHDFVA